MHGPSAAGIEMRQRLRPFAADEQGEILTPLTVMRDGDAPRQRILGQGLNEIGRSPGRISGTAQEPLARNARKAGDQTAKRPLIRLGIDKKIAAETLPGLRILAGAKAEDDAGRLGAQALDDEFDERTLTDSNEWLGQATGAAQTPSTAAAKNDRGDLFRLQGRVARDNRG